MDQFDEARQNGTVSNDPQVAPPSGGRAAISNEHTLSDEHDQGNRVRDKRPGHKRTVTLHVSEFIGRSMRHVLPAGSKFIRDCGLLATAHRQARLAAARAARVMPDPQAAAIEAAHVFLARVTGHDPSRCLHCAHGHWRTLAVLPPALGCRDGPPMTPAAHPSQ